MIANEARRLKEIQKIYFSLLKDCFKEQYESVKTEGGDVEKGIKKWINGSKEGDLVYTFKRRLEDLENFWKRNYEELKENIISLDILPIYSVSRPMFLKRQISSAGLYVDTIVCHDETISGVRNLNILPPQKGISIAVNLLRDYLDLLSLEQCFISDLETPFAIVCPGGRDFDFDVEKNIIIYSKELMTQYTNDLLETHYNNLEEVEENTKKIVGSRDIKKAIKKLNILPAPFKEPKNDIERLSQCFMRMRILEKQSKVYIYDKPRLWDLIVSFLTELSVLEGQLHGSIELDLAPIFPRYTWDLYKWRVDKGNLENSKILGWEERQISAITTAMQYENLDWLSNITPDGIIELRKEGFLEEFRQSIRLARKRMTLEEGADFAGLAKTVEEDIKAAIAEHIESNKRLEEEACKRLKIETGKLLGKISLGIASFFIPPISILNFIADAKKYASELLKNRKILNSIPSRLRRGPWGLMIEAKQDK